LNFRINQIFGIQVCKSLCISGIGTGDLGVVALRNDVAIVIKLKD